MISSRPVAHSHLSVRGSDITGPAPYWVHLPDCLILTQLRMSQMEHFIPVTPKYNSPLRVHLTTKGITIQPLNNLLLTSNSLAASLDSAQNVSHRHPLPSNSVPITLIHTSSISSLVHSHLPTIFLLLALPSSYTMDHTAARVQSFKNVSQTMPFLA